MIVTAIIPTRNRCATLGRTLDSLARVAGTELEILVVDNGSTDGTAAVFEAMRARHPERSWRYVHEPMPGLLSGRHRGAQEAGGAICAYLDDDVRVAPGWLAAIQAGFQRPEVVLMGGPSTPLFETPPPPWLERFWSEDAQGRHCVWLSLFEGGSRIRTIDPRYVLGLNFAIRRASLFELGGFNPDCLPRALQRFQGDGETGLSLKLQRTGQTALYHPAMAVAHEIADARLTFRYFEERAFYQGVCDSYTQLRAHGGVAVAEPAWRDGWQRLKRRLRRLVRGGNREAAQLQDLTDAAYRAGGRFHREEFAADPRLREWVLRPDYLDYRLPDGWERYVPHSPGAS